MNRISVWHVLPYVAIAALLLGLAVMRGNMLKEKAVSQQVKAVNESLLVANKINAETIKAQNDNRAINDAVISKMANDVAAIRLRGSQTTTQIREVYRNDPQAKAWADLPIPVSVAGLLNANAESNNRNPNCIFVARCSFG